MTDDLPERLKAYLARDNVEIIAPDACELIEEAASLIQRLEGERDEWKADAKHYISRCGEQQEALETAEQALSASQKEVETLKLAVEAYQAIHASVLADLHTAHQLRGNGGSQWMREDDAELRSDFRKAGELAASALQTGGKEHG